MVINSRQKIFFKNGYCHGGHELSIGSVGGRTNNIVKNVTATDTVMENSQQSFHVKAVSGANGPVNGITHHKIKKKEGYGYRILVDGQPTNGVSITNFILPNVSGTINSSVVNIYIQLGVGDYSG